MKFLGSERQIPITSVKQAEEAALERRKQENNWEKRAREEAPWLAIGERPRVEKSELS
jgi:hypothetical protein